MGYPEDMNESEVDEVFHMEILPSVCQIHIHIQVGFVSQILPMPGEDPSRLYMADDNTGDIFREICELTYSLS